MAFPRRASTIHGLAKKTIFATGLSFVLAATMAVPPAAAQNIAPTACTYGGEDILTTVTNPAPADRQAIMDLIHRFFWALDKPTLLGVDEMVVENSVTYELCTASFTQLQLKTGWEQLNVYLGDVQSTIAQNSSSTRHIEANTLLNAIDINTVEGKSTVVVTIQFAGIETPVLDYTATLLTVFKRDGKNWKFSKLTTIMDGPQITLRAR